MTDDPNKTPRQEVAEDLAAARAAANEAEHDVGRIGEDEPTVPVGPTNEEAAEAAKGSIQIGGGPDSDVG